MSATTDQKQPTRDDLTVLDGIASIDDLTLARLYRTSMLTDSLRDSARDLLATGGWNKPMIHRMAERYRLLRAQAQVSLPQADATEIIAWTPELDDDDVKLNIEAIFEAAAVLATYIDSVLAAPVWVAQQRSIAAQVAQARTVMSFPASGDGQRPVPAAGQYM